MSKRITLSLLAALAAAQAATLIEAVDKGSVPAVKQHLASKVDVNAPTVDTSTALHHAVEGNNLEIVNLLLAAGANPKVETRYKITPLAMAAANGNAAIIERLLTAGVDPNSTSEAGQTALMTAALNGRVDAVKLLLAKGANVNAIEPYRGQTALMWAAGEGNVAATEMLIEFGANVKAKSKAGYTALLLAILNNQIGTSKALLQHGANVEDQTPDGTTAVNMAAVNAYFDLASMLVDMGANVNAPDPRGSLLHTLVWMAKPGSSWEAAATADDPQPVPRGTGRVTATELAKKILEKGANVNARLKWVEPKMTKELGATRNPPNINLGRHHLSFNGSTPFYNAARNGDPEFMKLLLKFGADPKINTDAGVTPLMAAACLDFYEGETPGPTTGVSEADRLEAVKMTLELAGNINARTDFGSFPVVGSPEQTLMTYPSNVEDLFKLGVGDPRWNGMTALHGAVISNQLTILQYLIDHGAELEAKNTYGWTPLMIAKGIFMANSKKEFPKAVAILTKAGAKQ